MTDQLVSIGAWIPEACIDPVILRQMRYETAARENVENLADDTDLIDALGKLSGHDGVDHSIRAIIDDFASRSAQIGEIARSQAVENCEPDPDQKGEYWACKFANKLAEMYRKRVFKAIEQTN